MSSGSSGSSTRPGRSRVVERGAVERLWWGEDPLATIGRAVLAPLSALYGAAVTLRGRLYDRGTLRTCALPLPAISVGNLTVGGTGKTPVSAWLAAELRRRGARPALVLRGYGGDEPLVHERLNPGVPVIVGADRVDAAKRAAAGGSDVVVLDDAFQHRRAARHVDLVLVSADRWTSRRLLLPAGPWREPLSALRRASAVVVTRKAAIDARVDDVLRELASVVPGVPRAVVRLAPDALRAVAGQGDRPLETLAGARVFAIAAIGDPVAFVRQLEVLGAEVSLAVFADHHAFDREEIAELAARGWAADLVVCTLKDAVKLEPRWPRAGPALWYVSQRVVVERGGEILGSLVDGLLRARSPIS